MDSFPEEILKKAQIHLSEEEQRLETRIRELVAQDPFSDPARATDNAASDTEASEESDHDRVDALINQMREQLVSVRQALARISENTYGFCTSCGVMIDRDRLTVLPAATLCLTCEAGKKK
jgi:RNA polymerase-binding transcription factor DksA